VISGVDNDYDLKRRTGLLKNTVNCCPYGGTIDRRYDNRDAQTIHYSESSSLLEFQVLVGIRLQPAIDYSWNALAESTCTYR
jgi:hypothetical protein